MKTILISLVFAQLLVPSNSFSPITGVNRFKVQKISEKIKEVQSEDPNFEAHLAGFIKAGSLPLFTSESIEGVTENCPTITDVYECFSDENRPSPDIAVELRKRFKVIEGGGRKAAKELKNANYELSVELEELADELAETTEKFVQTALWWDKWSRPSPDLGSELRDKERGTVNDPNFVDNLPRFMSAGLKERETPDLPSELRLMKYKSMASVKRIAASELRQAATSNSELAAELEEMADEIEESHLKFEELARTLRSARDLNRPELK